MISFANAQVESQWKGEQNNVSTVRTKVETRQPKKMESTQGVWYMSVMEEERLEQEEARKAELKAERDPLIFNIRSLLRDSLRG